MNAGELRQLLQDHSDALQALGADVSAIEIEPPATDAEVAAVQEALGVELPRSFAAGLCELSRSVNWSWSIDWDLSSPFDQNFSGELAWSIESLVEEQATWQGWVENCFDDPEDWYDSVWHSKLAFHSVGNGDQLAVDLDPERSGAIIYLSHDDGTGHGYVMADSLMDLVDRWAPLACPGPEDWQWLPFVPWDEGPIDPTCANAASWMALMGLRTDSVRTAPVHPSDDLVDSLYAAYRRSPESIEGLTAGMRALKCSSPSRLADVVSMLSSESDAIQETAADLLGEWKDETTVPALADLARTGQHNGRMAALRSIAWIGGPASEAAVKELRETLPSDWVRALDRWT